MKFSQISSITLLGVSVASTASAFSVQSVSSASRLLSNPRPTMEASPSTTTLFMSDFESDFASAMPEAPKMSLQEFLIQSADRSISNIRGSLGEGVEAVPELEALEKMRNSEEDVSAEDLALAIYELMIERGMTYDEDPDNGVLTPTEFDIKANLDVPEVKDEFSYLYRYGMRLISNGMASVDGIKRVVTERLIARTGKTPEEFDEWLGF